jgi:hypothetical protein
MLRQNANPNYMFGEPWQELMLQHDDDYRYYRDRDQYPKRKFKKTFVPFFDEERRAERFKNYVIEQRNRRIQSYHEARHRDHTALSEVIKQRREEARRLQLQNKMKSIPLSQAIQANKTYQSYVGEAPVDKTTSGSTHAHASLQPVKQDESMEYHTRDQITVLQKMNAYLCLIGGELISGEGYCNGITILWLTMMASNTENLFYEMIDCIALCPYHKLDDIYETISTFLEWIELGQNPGDHFGKNCQQHELHKIVGAEYHDFCEQDTTRAQFASKLDEQAKQDVMVCIQGWGIAKNNNVRIGHTIGLFNRNGVYHVFDPNYSEGRAREVFKPRLVPELWDRLFNLPVVLHYTDTHFIRISSAREKYLSQIKVSKSGLFGRNGNTSAVGDIAIAPATAEVPLLAAYCR